MPLRSADRPMSMRRTIAQPDPDMVESPPRAAVKSTIAGTGDAVPREGAWN